MGDEIDGQVSKYPGTIKNSYAVQDQVDFFQSVVRPLFEGDRVLAMAGEYAAHVGWIADASGINFYKYLKGDNAVPLFSNDAQINFVFPNKSIQTYRASHNVGKSSRIDPTHGAGEKATTYDTDGAFSAHYHTSGIKVLSVNHRNVLKVLAAIGTFQGSNPDLKRGEHGIRGAMGMPSLPGQSLIVKPPNNGDSELSYPVEESESSLYLLAALRLWDEVIEPQGLGEEILSEVREKFGVPSATYIPSQSRRQGQEDDKEKIDRLAQRERIKTLGDVGDQQSHWFSQAYERPYTEIAYRVESQLPFTIEQIANYRLGSGSSRVKEIEDYLRGLTEDPYRYALWLGNIIDKNTGSLNIRKKILDDLVAVFRNLGDRNLGLLLSKTLTEARWKRPVGAADSVDLLPIPPATYLARQGDVKLVLPEGLVTLTVAGEGYKQKIPIQVYDRAGGTNRRGKPLLGHESNYLGLSPKPAVMMGGHMKNSAWGRDHHPENKFEPWPIFMTPGWLSAVDRGPGGLGSSETPVLLMVPKEDHVQMVPASNQEQRDLFLTALTIYLGLEKSGQLESVQSKKKR